MHRLLLILPISFFALSLHAQQRDTVVHQKDGKADGFYITLLPEKPSKGLLMILCGFGMPKDVEIETQLPAKACAAGYTVVMPFLLRADVPDPEGLFFQKLAALIPEVAARYKTPANKFILGGQSWAGHQALLYAEKASQPGNSSWIKPDLVFGVDPPLDMKRLYNGNMRAMNIEPEKAKGSEGEFVNNLFKATFGGDPIQQPQAYEAASSFCRDAKDGGNARFLTGIPVRLYSDPDLNWFITERNRPVEWSNTADVTACIVQLRLLGNKEAEYVSCLGKGYTPDGKRHPHAFSMLDPDEFISWADKKLGYRQN